jgi:hypothetical protein
VRVKQATFACVRCGGPGHRRTGDVNRAKRLGLPLYCSRACSGPGAGETRRKNPPRESPAGIAHKAAYDKARRDALGETLRASKREAYHRLVATRGGEVRAKQKAYRDANVDYHNEYCRRPEYREKKHTYDVRRHWAGDEWADAAVVMRVVEDEIDKRATKGQIAEQKGTVNKCQTRRRELEKLERYESQKRVVGNAQRHQERKGAAGGG